MRNLLIKFIAEEFKNIKDLEIDCLQLGKKKLPDHLVISNQSRSFAIGFLNANANSFTARIQNFNELTVKHKQTKFYLLRDERQPEITGKVGKGEIKKLNNTANGEFIIMDKANRMSFELIYKMITDIQNRDLEVEIEEALPNLMSFLKDYWLINLFEQF
jgi:RecG-like helicase